MSYRVLVVCGTGMGSSMILKVMVDKAVSEAGFPCTVSSDLASSVSQFKPDILVAGSDLAPTLVETGIPVVAVRNIMNVEEIKNGLAQVIADLGGNEF